MYDYIIVGAGSAGCVLAHRLSADPHATVLLLEAGQRDTQREIHIPAAFSKLFKGPCDWAYFTEPQPRLAGRKLFWPRGKVLGGSSSINAMMYVRGNRRDYDDWRDAGCDGWGFEDVLPYFRKGENQERGPSAHHGVGGPLNVADLRTINPISAAFVASAVESGAARVEDFNGSEQDGVGFYQVTQKRGQRHSAAAAYLTPILSRPNLTVETGAFVTEIVFDGSRAVGVAYTRDGRSCEARARHEVILSGGAINSPQMLLVSGIGPADHLSSLDIPVRVDLPGVGQNLQDHLLAIVAFECLKPVSLANAESALNILKYLLFRRGPLSSNVGEAGGFLRTSPDAETPDVQVVFGPTYYLEHGFRRIAGHGFSVGAILLRPRSHGWLALRSADPAVAPVIEPNYFEDEDDVRVLVEGVKRCREMAGGPSLDPFRGREVVPGSTTRTDAEIADFLRASVETLYHPVGTCKMGVDSAAVVDPCLRVRGVEGLRVVDASVMPTIVGGNTNAPTIMIAEKASDLILADRG